MSRLRGSGPRHSPSTLGEAKPKEATVFTQRSGYDDVSNSLVMLYVVRDFAIGECGEDYNLYGCTVRMITLRN